MEGNSIVLSIIVPVYNTPIKYIEECLGSIQQLSINYQIIIVNDGSTATGILDYLATIQKENKDILIINKENGGLPSARNAGIQQANTKYIFCLDSDDTLSVQNFERAFNFLKNNPQYDILYSDYQNFGDLTNLGKSRKHDRAYLFLNGNYISACSFFKKEVWETIKGYDETLKVCEDYDFWVRAALQNFKFYYFQPPIFNYRRVNDGKSLSQNKAGEFFKTKKYIREKVSANHISHEDIHNYIINSFRQNKINFIKLCLALISEKLVEKLISFKIFKSKYFVG